MIYDTLNNLPNYLAGTMTDFAGFAGIAAVIGFQFLRRRKET